MCGIVGFYGKEGNKEQVIKKMADRIKHRGLRWWKPTYVYRGQKTSSNI